MSTKTKRKAPANGAKRLQALTGVVGVTANLQQRFEAVMRAQNEAGKQARGKLHHKITWNSLAVKLGQTRQNLLSRISSDRVAYSRICDLCDALKVSPDDFVDCIYTIEDNAEAL